MTAGTTVAIHQPNFFPWLGWFHKLARADVFVLLDDVRFSRGSWTNRTRVLVNGAATWITVPVARGSDHTGEIRTTKINEETPWRSKILKTLENTYRRSAGFDEAYALVRPLLENPADRLGSYNEAALRAVADALGLDASRFVRSSMLHAKGTATQRLVELVRAVGGTTYLSGGGAGGYQSEALFAEAGMSLVYADFVTKPYPQRAPEFVGGLSVIDVMMNCGLRGTGKLVVAGGRP